MKVLFLSTHLNTGGITSYLFTMAKGLIRRGHEVHVATSGGNMEKAFASAGAKLLTLNIRTKSELSPKVYGALTPLARYIRENRIDVIHAQTRVTQVMGAWLRKMTGRAVVSTCHGFFTPRFSRKLFPCWGDAVIAISKPVAEHLSRDLGVDGRKVFLIESGIDLDAFTPPVGAVRRERRHRFDLGDGPVIGIVARLSDVKGQDVLVAAMAKVAQHLNHAKLVLVGEGKMEKALRAQVRQLNLDGCVRFFTAVERTAEMLSVFDVFTMPSRQEGLGLSIMEAQAAGLPVVASRVGGIPELIEDGKTGVLVDPEDPDGLAEAIVGLLRDPARMEAIGKAGREFIRANYPAAKMCERVERLYQQLTEKKA